MTPSYPVLTWVDRSYPIVAYQAGTSTDSQRIARVYFTEAVSCPDDWAGSYVKAITAFTGSSAYALKKNGASTGTATFSAAGTTAALATSGGATTFAAGDYLDIIAPATHDTTGADLSFAIACTKVS